MGKCKFVEYYCNISNFPRFATLLTTFTQQTLLFFKFDEKFMYIINERDIIPQPFNLCIVINRELSSRSIESSAK